MPRPRQEVRDAVGEYRRRSDEESRLYQQLLTGRRQAWVVWPGRDTRRELTP